MIVHFSWASSIGGSEETSMERSERLTFSVQAQDWAQPCLFLKYTDDTYLTMVSVQVLEFLDITHGDPLGQRRSAQVRRGKGRQGVRCICRKTRLKQVSDILVTATTCVSIYWSRLRGSTRGRPFQITTCPTEFEAFVDSWNPTGSCSYRCTADGVGSVQLQTALGCCYNAESCHTGCQTYHPPSVEVWTYTESTEDIFRGKTGNQGHQRYFTHKSATLASTSSKNKWIERNEADLGFWWTGCCLMAMYWVSSCSRLSGESGFTRMP